MIKRWFYGLVPEPVTEHRQKGYIRHLCLTLDQAMARVHDDRGGWIPGAHVEVSYEGVGEDEGFKQSEFLTPDGWLQGFDDGTKEERQRLESEAKKVAG